MLRFVYVIVECVFVPLCNVLAIRFQSLFNIEHDSFHVILVTCWVLGRVNDEWSKLDHKSRNLPDLSALDICFWISYKDCLFSLLLRDWSFIWLFSNLKKKKHLVLEMITFYSWGLLRKFVRWYRCKTNIFANNFLCKDSSTRAWKSWKQSLLNMNIFTMQFSGKLGHVKK